MSFLNVLAEIAALNFAFILQLFIDHPFWVFGFAAAAYFLYDKRILLGFPIVVLFIYAQVDLTTLTGWAFGIVPAIWLFFNIFFAIFTNKYKFLGKYADYGGFAIFAILLIVSVKTGVF